MKKQALQYTIRGISRELDRYLKALAKQKGESLNALILDFLLRQTKLSPSPQIYSDLDHLFGVWIKDPETEKAIDEQRIIDEELWK